MKTLTSNSKKAKINSPFLTINSKTIKTKPITNQMKEILFGLLGLEKFEVFLNNYYLKNNGTEFKSYKTYTNNLKKHLKKLNISFNNFANIRSISELQKIQRRIEDNFGFRKSEKEIQDLFCIYDLYIKFAEWANSTSPAIPVETSYAIAA